MNQPEPARIVFITGTDTGVGKTLLTGLLLEHLRQTGRHALAMKPFCSGGTGDVDLLARVQEGELSAREINPFCFPEPVAPLVAARAHRRRISLAEVTRCVRSLARRCECLLVEGSGGLLAPLGEGFSAVDLIAHLRCDVVVVARDQLGVINHTLLTLSALRAAAGVRQKVVLMGVPHPDASVASNARILRELSRRAPVFSLGFLGFRCLSAQAVCRNARGLRRSLAAIVAKR